ERAVKGDNQVIMRTLSTVTRSAAGKDDKELGALSLKAAEALLKAAGDKEPMALMNMAEACVATGDKEKAKEYAEKAVAAAADTRALKRSIEQRVKKLLEDE